MQFGKYSSAVLVAAVLELHKCSCRQLQLGHKASCTERIEYKRRREVGIGYQSTMARIGIIRAWFLFALVVLIESKVRKPARLPEDVPLKPPAQQPKVPTEPAAEIKPANFRAHFKKRGKRSIIIWYTQTI